MDFIKEYQAEEFEVSSDRSIKTDERMDLSNSFKGYTYKYFIFINYFFLAFSAKSNLHNLEYKKEMVTL